MTNSTDERAFVADPKALNDHCTRVFAPFMEDKPQAIQLHPFTFACEPQGNRVNLVLYPKPETFGGLVLPKDQDVSEPMGLGIIAAIGATAFRSNTPSLAGMNYYPDPSKLLLKTAIIGAHRGVALRLDYTRDSLFRATTVVVNAVDILCVVFEELYAPYETTNDYFRALRPNAPL